VQDARTDGTVMPPQAVLHRLANLGVQEVQLRLVNQDLPLDRYRPSLLAGLELAGRNSKA
jgi:hypothetical protein